MAATEVALPLEAWGSQFLLWLLAQDEVVRQQFFLCRQLVGDLPQKSAGGGTGRIRALATAVADSLPAFADLKNKIHSRPDAGDAERVARFRLDVGTALTEGIDQRLVSRTSCGRPSRRLGKRCGRERRLPRWRVRCCSASPCCGRPSEPCRCCPGSRSAW